MQLKIHLRCEENTAMTTTTAIENEGQRNKVSKIGSTVVGTRNQPIGNKNGQSNNQSNHPEAEKQKKVHNPQVNAHSNPRLLEPAADWFTTVSTGKPRPCDEFSRRLAAPAGRLQHTLVSIHFKIQLK